MIVKYKKREVEIDQLKGTKDEPIVARAYYLDGDEEDLSDDEMIDIVEECGSDIYDYMNEDKIEQFDLVNGR